MPNNKVSWGMVLLAGVLSFPASLVLGGIGLALSLAGGDSSGGLAVLFGILPFGAFVALLIYKLTLKSETGLLLMTNSGYARLFVSKNYAAIKQVTESVFKILEDPEKYKNEYYDVTINGSTIHGNFVVGDVHGNVSHAGGSIDLTQSGGQSSNPPPPNAHGSPPPPVANPQGLQGVPGRSDPARQRPAGSPTITGSSIQGNTVIGGDLHGGAHYESVSGERSISLEDLSAKLEALEVSILDGETKREISEVRSAVDLHIREPDSSSIDQLKVRLRAAMPTLQQLTIGAAGSSLATEVYRLVSRFVA